MICIQGAAAVTHFRCLNFSPGLNFVLSLLVVSLLLSRRHIPEAHDFEVFRLSGIRLPRGIGANQRSSRVFHFRIAQDADHASNCLAMRSDVPTLLDVLEICAKLLEPVYALR